MLSFLRGRIGAPEERFDSKNRIVATAGDRYRAESQEMDMKNSFKLLAATIAGLLASSDSLVAHHGAAAYELQTLTTFAATVRSFDWRNPHALLHFQVTDEKGAIANWTAETAGLIILVRAGWGRDVLKPGDQVSVVGRRATNGSHNMLLQRVVLPSGQELTSFVPPK
jgi:hypothetical protein